MFIQLTLQVISSRTERACVRAYVAVPHRVHLQRVLVRERLTANRTHVRPIAGMQPRMNSKIRRRSKATSAFVAEMRALVTIHVSSHENLLFKRLAAHIAEVLRWGRLWSFAQRDVFVEGACLFKALIALGAGKGACTRILERLYTCKQIGDG